MGVPPNVQDMVTALTYIIILIYFFFFLISINSAVCLFKTYHHHARVLWMVAKALLWYSGWLPRCCYGILGGC